MRLVLAVAVLMLSGCANLDGARKYLLGDPNARPSSTLFVNATVDAIAAPEAPTLRRYFLTPGNEGVNEGDLQYREFAAYVDRAMAYRGFTKVIDPKAADIAVVLQYGIGDARTVVRTYNLPIFGQTGVSSSRTTGSLSPGYGGSANYNATTYNTPTYGITGTMQRQVEETTYSRFMMLSAYDWQEFGRTQKESQVWKISVNSVGPSGDLRMIFPLMLGATLPGIGKSSTGMLVGHIGDQDDNVYIVKRLPLQPVPE